MISWVTMQDRWIKKNNGEYMRINDAKEFSRFCDGYFRGLQAHGVYLTDIEFEDLTFEAIDDFLDESYNLWISTKDYVESGKIDGKGKE